MAQIADKKGFDEGLDQDTEPRKVGGLRDAVNIRYGTTDNGNDGTAENTKGNLLIVNPNLPAGTNKCIGGFEDKRDLSIIFFNFNSNNDHGIYRFYSTTQTIEKLVVSSVLNFNISSRINSCDLIDELLYWTDGDNSPRKINIDKANETAKKRKFNLYFGDDSGSGEAYFSFITDPNGNLVASWFFFAPTQDSLSELTKLYLANVPVAASAVAVFTSCQQFVEVELRLVGGGILTFFVERTHLILLLRIFIQEHLLTGLSTASKIRFNVNRSLSQKRIPRAKIILYRTKYFNSAYALFMMTTKKRCGRHTVTFLLSPRHARTLHRPANSIILN